MYLTVFVFKHDDDAGEKKKWAPIEVCRTNSIKVVVNL